jgi:hypothetical protein
MMTKTTARAIMAVCAAAALILFAGLNAKHLAPQPLVSAAAVEGDATRPLVMDRVEDPPYVGLGSTIRIDFAKSRPDTICVTDILINQDGSPKYDRRLDKTVAYALSGDTLSFAVETNWATALSSDSQDYQKGNTYRWYRIQCAWQNGDEKEYALYLRTDFTPDAAAMR